MVKGAQRYQFAYFEGPKVIHRNLDGTASIVEVKRLLNEGFQQAEMRAAANLIRIRIGKLGQPIVLAKPAKNMITEAVQRHDREKSRILPEGEPIDFLVRLGVMTQDGRVVAAKYDKFKQINRFLEMAADVADRLKPDGLLHVIDFGSGRSYLTFALYHYFTAVRGRDVSIVGLDLKGDVVDFCNTIASELGYTNLKFVVGDIAEYISANDVDMVVSLHACDTKATDDALEYRRFSWGATVILLGSLLPPPLSSFATRIRSEVSTSLLLKHGITKGEIGSPDYRCSAC